jgi:hypothetical protein
MQILVVVYLHKCILFLLDKRELLGQTSCLPGSQRVEGTASGERTSRIDPQAPGKSETIVVQESLWSQK